MPITKYPEGSNITILNTIYQRSKKDEVTGKWGKDGIEIIYKDNVTGKKGHNYIEDPDYHYYKLKPNIQYDYNKLFVKVDEVDECIAPYSQIEKDIAERTNNLEFFYENIKNGNRRGNRALHTIPSIFDSDAKIQDHYRALFAKQYKNPVIPITKAYLDIEADTIYAANDFPELGECPINATTIIDEKTKTINVFLLRDKDNPQCAQFEERVKNGSIYEELRFFIWNHIVNSNKDESEKMQKAFDKSGLAEYEIIFNFYDIEIMLITALFELINKVQPDFLLAWNMAFDIPYIIERIKMLRYDPAEIMCHPDFDHKVAEYFVDTQHSSMYELRGDYYNISSYTVYMDQLIQFASRRKGQAAFPNFKLDTAGEIISGVNKLDWSHIVSKLKDLPRVDYKTFVFYNIMDTIVQKFIEQDCQDTEYIFSTAVLDDTRYSKCHRQTVYLINKFKKFCWERGYVVNNNCNLDNQSIPYAGAIVGDPTHNSDYAKVRIYDEIMNLYDNLDDFDFKSLYPSLAREHNTSPDTLIGKIQINQKIYQNENPFMYDEYDRGGAFMEDYTTDNPVEFCRRWMHMAGYKDLLADVNEYMTKVNVTNPSYDGYTRPFVILNPDGVYNKTTERPNNIVPFVIHGNKQMITNAVAQVGGF